MSKREYRISKTIQASMYMDQNEACGVRREFSADDIAMNVSTYLLVVVSVALLCGMYIK